MHSASSRSPVVQCVSHSRTVGRLALHLHAVGLHRRARFAHPLDHLRLGEARVVKGHRHHAAEKRGPRAPDAFDLLRLALQLLLRRARGAPAEMQDRLAVLLVADRREFLRDLAARLRRRSRRGSKSIVTAWSDASISVRTTPGSSGSRAGERSSSRLPWSFTTFKSRFATSN